MAITDVSAKFYFMDIDLAKWTLVKDGQIEDDFEGFDDEAIFELTDGTFYYQSAYKYHYFYGYRPSVRIYSHGMSQIIVPDGMDDYVEIQQTTASKSRIISDFKGWSGDTLFQFENGQTWKQAKYQYKYFYAYRPEVKVVKIGTHHIMTVKGKGIRVERIK